MTCFIAWVRIDVQFCERKIYHMSCTDPSDKLCSECESSSDCNVDDLIWMRSCSATATDQRFTSLGLTIRPAIDQNLCFTIMGYGTAQDTDGLTITTPIQLKLCEENNRNQQFVGFQSSGKFELKPIENQERCLAQLHHPKSYEKIFPRLCTNARRDTTSNWITF